MADLFLHIRQYYKDETVNYIYLQTNHSLI